MICNLAVYITDLSLVEAVSIVNYETFQCLSIIRPLHFLYSLQLIRCMNILQSSSSVPTYCSYTCDQLRLSPWRMHLHQRTIINFSPDTAIKYQTLCSTLPLPKPLPNTILRQLSASKAISLAFSLDISLQQAAHGTVRDHICKFCAHYKRYTVI